MHHKKREHPSNIICKYFMTNNCRRSARQGADCWYRHEMLPVTAQSVARQNQNMPQIGSPDWNTNFPKLPTLSQSTVVGLKQQMWTMMNQQNQQQQEMKLMMSQIMSLNM